MSYSTGGYTWQTLDSAAEVAALKAEASRPEYSALTPVQIAATILRRPLVANTNPAPQLPDPAKVNMVNLVGMLSKANLATIPEDSLARAALAIREQDVEYLTFTLTVWEAKNYINATTKAALLADLTATVDDPTHPAQVPGTAPATTAIGRPVASLTPLDITKAIELG